MHRRRIDHMFIDLVRHHIGVIALRQFPDQQQLFPCKHLAAGVGGVADDDRFGPCPKSRFDERRVKAVIRRHQRNVDRLGPGENGIRSVIFIERGEHQHLIPRIAERHHGAHHRLGSAAGNQHLGLRVRFHACGSAVFFRQSRAEIGCSVGDGILVRSLIGHFCQRVHQLLRRIKVRKALGEIDGVVFVADPRHPADHGIGKQTDTSGQRFHACSSRSRIRRKALIAASPSFRVCTSLA